MAQQFRRVVTGHDDKGVAGIESDQIAEHILQRPNRPGVTLTNFWLSDSTPAEYDGDVETCEGPFILHPPTHGSAFRCVEFLPEDPEVMATLDGPSAFAEMGAGANIVKDARHPFMHRTDSLDYAIIVSGEIYMLMDEEDVHLKTGDVVVQRGTNHAWSNRGTEPCVICFVLIDGVTTQSAAPEFKKGIPPR
ncbi:cupin domain-containing protein [Marinomonas sp.]|nr:cupin domain-containing protein [Marinomonas sp.]MDB4837294.1 cupin domain-containing protein [Marinomonas sp.]